MYQHLFRFLCQICCMIRKNLIQLLFCFYYNHQVKSIFLYNSIFFTNPTIKLITTYPFDINFITLSFNFFFYPKFLLICFLQFFFVKHSNNFFTYEITNNKCPRNSILNFFNNKIFLRPILNISVCTNVFVF